MIPFFVVDRPMSLEIVKSYWSTKPAIKYGIMTHALTSERFRKLFASYPCVDSGVCRACGREVVENDAPCSEGRQLRSNVVKMGDSGIFAEGGRLPYADLFTRYEDMDVDYGVMIDYVMDARKTIESAHEAVEIFRDGQYSFQLVLVAQGKEAHEYIDCYGELDKLGNFPIAVGGMLRRKANSARYVHLSQEELLDNVLGAIRQTFDPDWLFALGVYHPKRHDILSRHGVTGADYKGWIFNYEHRRDLLSKVETPLREGGIVPLWSWLYQLLVRRQALERQLRRRTLALRGNLEGDTLDLAKTRRRRTLEFIARLDKEILSLVVGEYRADGLSPVDQERVDQAVEILSMSDQAVRFAGVHGYFETKILPKLAQQVEGNSK